MTKRKTVDPLAHVRVEVRRAQKGVFGLFRKVKTAVDEEDWSGISLWGHLMAAYAQDVNLLENVVLRKKRRGK